MTVAYHRGTNIRDALIRSELFSAPDENISLLIDNMED